MGDLPAERLAHHRRPFTFIGLDYMGPMLVTVGRRKEKRYVALFTCLTSRAIHLEVAASLSTDSALMCLKRFISRRGTPDKIYSDNGTAFVGSNNILKAMSEEGANTGITWSFIPPAAPHMGGAWERLVRSVKTALKVILRDRAPRDEVLHTALIEVEALVNSRPLTHVPLDPSSPALTPFHFILGESSPYHPVPVILDESDFLGRSDWRKAQCLADMFWSRWVKEYLPTLIPRRSPGQNREQTVTVGDMVLIVDPSLPRGTWPLGRIATVFPGRDGIVRVAEVSTSGGILRRPLKRLVKLPVDFQ
ncbi:uncharacterized protein LOC131841083 [Achroia grisella]|nr:uncharacterized protein LOC131841083 [Achroia grisella]